MPADAGIESKTVLHWRLISTAVIVTVMLVACWLDLHYSFGHAGAWLAPICLALTMLTTHEVLGLMRSGGFRPLPWAVHVGTVTVVLAACVPILWREYPARLPVPPAGWVLLGLVAAVGLVFVGEMLRYQGPGGVMVNAGLAVFTVCYVGLSMAFLAKVRLTGSNPAGLAALVSVIVVAKGTDIGAYVCGRLLGRHKLVPHLSPGKTIEGAAGGVVAACLGSFAVFHLVVPALVGSGARCPWGSWLAYTVVVALAAMVGDLAESLFKRDMDQKDSGKLVPGIGGVLDVMDSLLFAAPVAYAWWVLGLVYV
jgi:phosphatidate cytidylyltransferase